MSRLRQLKEKRAALYANICDVQKQYDGKEMDKEARANFEKLVADCNDLDKQIATEEALAEIQARSAKEKSEKKISERKEVDEKAESRAFIKSIFGLEMTPEERSLVKRSIDGTTANVLIPTSISNQIEKALLGRSAFMQAADVMTTVNGGDMIIPTINDTTQRAQIVTMYAQNTREKVHFGSVALKAYTYRTPTIALSYELIQDSIVNLEAYVAELLAERFARGINADITNGTGSEQPQGIVTAAKQVAKTGEGILFDDLVALRKAVKSAYHGNASYMMNTVTECDLMLMKDGNDRPLWLPSLRDGAPATILGKPVVINDDMGDNQIVYGDLKKYKVRMGKEFTVKVLNELLAEYLSIGLIGYGRADGRLIDAGTNPVAVLK